jgi:Fe-S cluster assembly ATP-binding protein
MENLLKIDNLQVNIEKKQVLNGINLSVNAGETHVLMGPNGAGKSTLGYSIMGNPRYTVTGGKIFFEGKDITELSADKRAALGIFLSFQTPLEVPGISLESFIRNAVQSRTGERVKLFHFQKELKAMMELLHMDPSYAGRDLNVGFSGGEKKRMEILQMSLLQPKLAILDEADSGLDIDAMKIVADGVNLWHNNNNSLLIITHHLDLLNLIHPDFVHIYSDGHIVRSGDKSLAEELEKNGYKAFLDNK